MKQPKTIVRGALKPFLPQLGGAGCLNPPQLLIQWPHRGRGGLETPQNLGGGTLKRTAAEGAGLAWLLRREGGDPDQWQRGMQIRARPARGRAGFAPRPLGGGAANERGRGGARPARGGRLAGSVVFSRARWSSRESGGGSGGAGEGRRSRWRRRDGSAEVRPGPGRPRRGEPAPGTGPVGWGTGKGCASPWGECPTHGGAASGPAPTGPPIATKGP